MEESMYFDSRTIEKSLENQTVPSKAIGYKSTNSLVSSGPSLLGLQMVIL